MASLNHLKCSMPNCFNNCGQHSKSRNTNKQFCEPHRKKRKEEVDVFKMNNGCANKNGKYGFPCVSSTIIHPATLDINHKDGNNLNRDESNIEVLCKMCHTMVTINHKHHLPKNKDTRRAKIVNTDLWVGLTNSS